MGGFFKIPPNLSQNWLRFKKILEKLCEVALVGLFKILPKIKQIGTLIMLMGQYFLKTCHLLGTFIGLLSKSAAAHPYQKPNLSTPGVFI